MPLNFFVAYLTLAFAGGVLVGASGLLALLWYCAETPEEAEPNVIAGKDI